jgi:hypothetical protein
MSRETSELVATICGGLAVLGIIAIRIDMHRLRRRKPMSSKDLVVHVEKRDRAVHDLVHFVMGYIHAEISKALPFGNECDYRIALMRIANACIDSAIQSDKVDSAKKVMEVR